MINNTIVQCYYKTLFPQKKSVDVLDLEKLVGLLWQVSLNCPTVRSFVGCGVFLHSELKLVVIYVICLCENPKININYKFPITPVCNNKEIT